MEENKQMEAQELENEILEQENEVPEQEVLVQKGYVPRPMWQRVMAWIGLAVVVAGVVLYYIQIANGGF